MNQHLWASEAFLCKIHCDLDFSEVVTNTRKFPAGNALALAARWHEASSLKQHAGQGLAFLLPQGMNKEHWPIQKEQLRLSGVLGSIFLLVATCQGNKPEWWIPNINTSTCYFFPEISFALSLCAGVCALDKIVTCQQILDSRRQLLEFTRFLGFRTRNLMRDT